MRSRSFQVTIHDAIATQMHSLLIRPTALWHDYSAETSIPEDSRTTIQFDSANLLSRLQTLREKTSTATNTASTITIIIIVTAAVIVRVTNEAAIAFNAKSSSLMPSQPSKSIDAIAATVATTHLQTRFTATTGWALSSSKGLVNQSTDNNQEKSVK